MIALMVTVVMMMTIPTDSDRYYRRRIYSDSMYLSVSRPMCWVK